MGEGAIGACDTSCRVEIQTPESRIVAQIDRSVPAAQNAPAGRVRALFDPPGILQSARFTLDTSAGAPPIRAEVKADAQGDYTLRIVDANHPQGRPPTDQEIQTVGRLTRSLPADESNALRDYVESTLENDATFAPAADAPQTGLQNPPATSSLPAQQVTFAPPGRNPRR